jgi:hypothetical protein
VATSRCAVAVEEYQRNPRPILPTGGFGDHFNSTARPHHEYVTAWLIANHVAPNHLLPGVDSSNTWEDIELVAHAAAELRVRALTIVTSDYQVERVRLLLEMHAPNLAPVIRGAHTSLPTDEQAALELHERTAIDAISRQA